MTAERMAMRKIREVLRIKIQNKMSDAWAARSVGCARSTIADYVTRAKKAGLDSWEKIEPMSETELDRLLFPTSSSDTCLNNPRRPIPNWADVHAELRKHKSINLTLSLIWEEYRKEHPDGYGQTQFFEYYRRWKQKLAISMRQEHRAGEKAFVDYCDGLPLVGEKEGELIPTQLFVGVLGASSYTFAEASLSQSLPCWLESHVRMYAYFEGVPGITVPDHLRSGISRSCRYEPEINPSYNDLAMHYGTCVIPARVRKPKDKAKAEVAVLVAQRWILGRLRSRKFRTIQEMNQAIRELLAGLNVKVTRYLGKSRRDLWETIDKPALKPLPVRSYEFAEWKKGGLRINYHFEFDEHFYSAPYTLLNKELWCRATATTVEILYRGDRVASHVRSYLKGKYTTLTEHMPEAHKAVAEWTPERIERWAAKIGPRSKQVVEMIMASKDHPQQGFNAALGVIRLAKAHSPERLEKACDKAIALHSPTYTTIRNMLTNRMESAPIPSTIASVVRGDAKPTADAAPAAEQLSLDLKNNIRGKGYYH